MSPLWQSKFVSQFAYIAPAPPEVLQLTPPSKFASHELPAPQFCESRSQLEGMLVTSSSGQLEQFVSDPRSEVHLPLVQMPDSHSVASAHAEPGGFCG
jgi:hypothetical protein